MEGALLEKALLNCPLQNLVLSFLLKCVFIYTEKSIHDLLLIFSYISTENINAEYLVNLSVHLLFVAENSINMSGHFSKNNAHCISQWQTGRAAGSRGPVVCT